MKQATMMALIAHRRAKMYDYEEDWPAMNYEDSDARFRDRAGREHRDHKQIAAKEIGEHHHANVAHAVHGRDAMSGHYEKKRLTLSEVADDWMKSLQNEDGTKGPHWTREQVNIVMKQRNIDCDPEYFWVAMNVLYSDYDKVLKKHNASNVEVYADLAKAFIEDKDAVDDKLCAYYEYVVEH